MKTFPGLIILTSLLITGAHAQEELDGISVPSGNQTSSDLAPFFASESALDAVETGIDLSFNPVSCLPDSIKKPGIYRLSRAMPLDDQDAFSTFELNLHINYDNSNDQLLLTYISGYQGKLVPSEQNSSAGNDVATSQWSQASAVLKAYYSNMGVSPDRSSRVAVTETGKEQILGLGVSDFSCDQSSGVINWDTGDNAYFNGSRGRVRIQELDEQRLAGYGEVSMYYLSGMFYEYFESVVNHYVNNWGATTRRFVLVPMKGERVKGPLIEGQR